MSNDNARRLSENDQAIISAYAEYGVALSKSEIEMYRSGWMARAVLQSAQPAPETRQDGDLKEWINRHKSHRDGMRRDTVYADDLLEYLRLAPAAVQADMVMISKEAAKFAAKCCASDNGQTEAFLLSCTSAKVGDQIPDYLLKECQYTQEIRQAVAALTPRPDTQEQG